MNPKTTNLKPNSVLLVVLACLLLCLLSESSYGQDDAHSLSFKISVSEDLKKEFKSDGRLFLFFNKDSNREPRFNPPLGYGYCMFAKNISGWNANEIQTISSTIGWDSFQPNSFLLEENPNNGMAFIEPWNIEQIPNGTYYVQAFWDQNTAESILNSPGDIYSEVVELDIEGTTEIDISLSKIIPPAQIMDHELIKEVIFLSDTLSKWWGKTTYLKAAILLPSGYFKNTGKSYPIRYDIAGFSGSYTRINNYLRDESFFKWWTSEEATQIINVYLDGNGPEGDCYQIDSEYGPYGYALTHELIPYIEDKYRGSSSPDTRFVSGCSTGGWSSLALQLFYPDYFNGVFSYSPDPVDFNNFLLVNIYMDKNLYINQYSNPQPVQRDLNGEVRISMKDFADQERLISHTGHYINSRSQLGIYDQLFSPRDSNNQPTPLFNQETGIIDSLVAEHWKKYDLLLYTKENWDKIGPKLQGKIFIWMGDMDNFYLNTALRKYDEFLKSTENPASDAEIIFEPMKGHCAGASQRARINKTAERIEEINRSKKE